MGMIDLAESIGLNRDFTVTGRHLLSSHNWVFLNDRDTCIAWHQGKRQIKGEHKILNILCVPRRGQLIRTLTRVTSTDSSLYFFLYVRFKTIALDVLPLWLTSMYKMPHTLGFVDIFLSFGYIDFWLRRFPTNTKDVLTRSQRGLNHHQRWLGYLQPDIHVLLCMELLRGYSNAPGFHGSFWKGRESYLHSIRQSYDYVF